MLHLALYLIEEHFKLAMRRKAILILTYLKHFKIINEHHISTLNVYYNFK